MSEVTFHGPAGRLEGRYQPAAFRRNAPIALILHPHPQFGGTMHNRVVHRMFHIFADRGFSVLRFNFRGVGRSAGAFSLGVGELSDAAAALDWLQRYNGPASECWVAGFSFGAWIGMQLLMRRPEIAGFVSVAPPATMYDFGFLAPCPSSGLILSGGVDRVAPPSAVSKLATDLQQQKGIAVEYKVVRGANHFFDNRLDPLALSVCRYLDRRNVRAPVSA